MKEYRDGDDGREERERISLPCLFEPRRRRVPVLAVAASIFSALAVLWALIMLFDRGDREIYVPAINTETEEWHGAFVSEEICNRCIRSSVSLSVGRMGSERFWGGFVISDDGWIITSSDMLGEKNEGQIRVRLFDGTECTVEAIREDGDLAYLKTDTGVLSAVDTSRRERELCIGEEIVCIAYGGSVVSGRLAQIYDDGTARIDALLDEEAEGAPVFDRYGNLLGIAFSGSAEGRAAVMQPLCLP